MPETNWLSVRQEAQRLLLAWMREEIPYSYEVKLAQQLLKYRFLPSEYFRDYQERWGRT